MAAVALIGASGAVGSRLLHELSTRGHQVTALARDPSKIARLTGVTAHQADMHDPQPLIELLRGHEVVISSVRFVDVNPTQLIDIVRTAGVPRYLVVGGAASLEIAPGQRLLDQPDFPPAYRQEASAGAIFLAELQQTTDLNWTFLSPSAIFFPGERTGQFRIGRDQLLTQADGSRISYEDYAVALVDEIENPSHARQRFTVGY